MWISQRWGRGLVLSVAMAAAGCSTLSERHAPYAPDQTKFLDIAAASLRVDTARAQAQDAPDRVGEYLDAGVTLSDLACEAWFTGLAKTERNATLAKDVMNVAGNLLLGVAGINGANPDNLARGALGLAAANTGFELYRAELLLGSIEEIRAKIREGRKVSAEALLQAKNVSFDAAQRRLMDYHQQCSVERITVLLNTSLSAVKFERPDVTLNQAVDQATATSLVSTLRLGDVNALIQDPDLLYLTHLALVTYPLPKVSDPEFVKTARDQAIVQIYVKSYNDLPTKVEKDAVVATLQRIGVLLKFGERLKTDLANGALQRELEARKELDQAEARLQARMDSLKNDEKFKQAFRLDSKSLTSRAITLEVLKATPGQTQERLDQWKGAANDAPHEGLQIDLDRVRKARTQLELASTSAARARAAAPTSGDVTPRIVPVGR